MSFFLSGIRVPHRKNTADKPVLSIEAPNTVKIPMSMHIGAPAKLAVKVGDTVKIGTLIGEAGGFVSSDIYASISGKVIKIEDFTLSNGAKTQAVVIESDGEMARDESLKAPVVASADDLTEAIRKSGVVGLGGAGFPTHVKFKVDPARIEALIVNGAECEPYITSDSYTMTERTDDIEVALTAIKKHFGIKKIIIGIEGNKKKAIASMKALAGKIEGAEVKVLPSVYPQGGEKVLIYHTTGKVVAQGKLPIDVGCIVVNCTTLAAIGRYLTDGTPLVEKCVTVDGSAIDNPENLIAPIGTSISYLLEAVGADTEKIGKVMFGGPMMGVAAYTLEAPIMKNTNAIVALNKKDSKIPSPTPCIHCGRCVAACPMSLNPTAYAKAMSFTNDADRAEILEKEKVNICMECGCCSYVCPAKRPLVENNKLAKAALRDFNAKKKNG
jgi:electron transport complex protein RnfC